MAQTLYVVIVEDRHADVQVSVWTDESAATNEAHRIALENGTPPDRLTVEAFRQLDEMNEPLTHEMRVDGWTYSEVYSVEGDSVRVQRVTLDQPANAVPSS